MNKFSLGIVDNYKSELEVRQPRLLKELETRESEFYTVVINVSRKTEPIINEISRVFATYTQHDMGHSIRIMEYMYDLISDIKRLSDLDIAILISSALLHDIGMAVREDDVKKIKNGSIIYSDIKFNAILKQKKGDEEEALREYVRLFHGRRSGDFIINELSDAFYIPSTPGVKFTQEVADVCIAHTEDISWLLDNLKPHSQKGKDNYSPLFCGMLLRLADILDIDSNRTPPFLYEYITPKGFSKVEWLQHFTIHNSQKIKTDNSGKKTITIYGECDDPSIHRKILEYLDWINIEIENALQLNESLVDQYKINIKYPLDNHIDPKGYTISNLKLSIDFNAISNLLMGERIYGEKKLGLRELIQNSIDACKVRNEIEEKQARYGDSEYRPAIKVILDEESGHFIVKDNGIGMSIEILKNYFLNVGISYYKSADFVLKEYDYKPIGNFGIGFLACFMLSKNVDIKTRYVNSHSNYSLSLVRESPYISMNEDKDVTFDGTEVMLNYTEVMELFNYDVSEVQSFLEKYFLTTDIDLSVINVIEKESIHITNGLWDNIVGVKKSKSTIIDLSDYLHDIEGYIEVDIRNYKYGDSFDDIPYNGTPYFYDGTLKEINIEEFNIGDLYNTDTHCISYIEIPIVDSYSIEEYKKAFDVLEDKEETLNRLKDKLNSITIFFLENEIELHITGVIEEGYDIFSNFQYEDLYEHDQEYDIPTIVEHNKFKLFFSKDRRIFLPINNETFFSFMKNELYLRSTLVSDFRQKFNKFSFINVKSLKMNVYNQNIISDVSRNRLDKESSTLIDSALNIVLCLWSLDKLNLSSEEKDVITDYLDTFYKEENNLIKSRE